LTDREIKELKEVRPEFYKELRQIFEEKEEPKILPHIR